MKVNIGAGRLVEMTDEEVASYAWGRGPLPARFGAEEKRLANGRPVRNEDDAYWFSQPPEIQKLRDLPEAERHNLAMELAEQGYLIDVPLMVWHWDPLATMVVRHNQGYTWVPSAKMQNISVAPGLSFPGLRSYDPNNPPPGAIRVTIDWAKGFEHTSPWMQGHPPEQF